MYGVMAFNTFQRLSEENKKKYRIILIELQLIITSKFLEFFSEENVKRESEDLV